LTARQIASSPDRLMASLVVHVHLYQPPREDPRTGEYPVEPGAAPYHDWNEKIAAECYRPIAPLLERMSFNVGATLFEWLDRKTPEISHAIVEADRASAARFGYGSAIAMPYHHVILPLASRRDKEIEVRWGIRDFERRYGRSPEGMWLPETAVDLETLDVLARAGIRFTALASHQVEIPPPFGQPATVRTSGGQRIAVFVYDGTLSHDVAFGALLKDPDDWLARLTLAPHDIGAPICLSIATDGETFGHHHTTGITALRGLLDGLDRTGLEALNYSAFLARHPPRSFARIVEDTSWSCAHGIERWRSNCGCRLVAGTSQEWRTSLREALDWLRGEIDAILASRDVVIPDDPAVAAKTQPMDWHARRMFSSCGWFFDHIEGVEPGICISHAVRACELAGEDSSRLLEGLRRRLPLTIDD
jgi:alpha-amylase/alpha-mannosidase (GH57 family)